MSFHAGDPLASVLAWVEEGEAGGAGGHRAKGAPAPAPLHVCDAWHIDNLEAGGGAAAGNMLNVVEAARGDGATLVLVEDCRCTPAPGVAYVEWWCKEPTEAFATAVHLGEVQMVRGDINFANRGTCIGTVVEAKRRARRR